MKAIEQYFPVLLFIMLYKVALALEFMDEILKCDIQVKGIEQYFPVVLFVFPSFLVKCNFSYLTVFWHSRSV